MAPRFEQPPVVHYTACGRARQTQVRETEPGCLAYIAHTVKGAKNKNTIIFYEKYKDKDALNIHSANLPKNFEKMFPLFEGKSDIKTCTEII